MEFVATVYLSLEAEDEIAAAERAWEAVARITKDTDETDYVRGAVVASVE